ncbi:MAG: (2Fe-2S)-binding protein [Deltaproteobacteria bacterium]|nr:MAG: (2Fe-2S)-binding protein [Deltaproteobacteria bacterium]
MSQEIAFTLNGNETKVAIQDHWTLLHLLREELGLLGTKEGCGSGECGACTVIVNGDAVNSCLYLAAEVNGKKVLTIEGLATADGTLHPIQQSFVDNGAIQCGFCSPGMIMSAKALLDENPNAKLEDIKHALAGNLCRCTGYVQIFNAVKLASGYRYDAVKVVAWQSKDDS